MTFIEDDGVDYNERLAELHQSLNELNSHSIALSEIISKNIKSLL
jgi:hypothetical protein